MEIKPIAGTFAREVTGVNLWEGLSPAQLGEVRAAWSDCHCPKPGDRRSGDGHDE